MDVFSTLQYIVRSSRHGCSLLVFILLPFLLKAQGRVLINEYLPWPNNTCGTTAEFIELYNFGPGPVNIGGYIITDGDYAITIPANTVLLPGKYFVLAGQAVIAQNCGNDLRNVTANLNWNTCGCTSAPIPATGDGFLTDGGSANEQIVLLDTNLAIIDAIVRSTPMELSSLITTSTVGGQYPARTFDLDNLTIQYETVGESAGRGNSFARKIDGGCGWIKDTQESAGDLNNTSGLVLDWSANLTLTKPTTCSGTGSVQVAVSNALLFPMRYTLAKDADGSFSYDANDVYTNGVDSTASTIALGGLDSGSYRLIIEGSLGCDATMFDFSILGCTGLILNQNSRGGGQARNESQPVFRIAENPFSDQCTILVNAASPGRMYVTVYDQLGRKVITEKMDVLRGNNMVRLPAYKMLRGMYIVQLQNEAGLPLETLKAIRR